MKNDNSVVGVSALKIPLSRPAARRLTATRTDFIPFGRDNRSVSLSGYDVPRISRYDRLKMLTRASVDLANPGISSEVSETDNQVVEKSVKRARKPRSRVQPLVPLPISEREIITFAEAAAIGPKSENALRHLAFMVSAYEKLDFEGKPHLAKFAKCICRQPGQRRVYLNRQRLLQFFAWEGVRND